MAKKSAASATKKSRKPSNKSSIGGGSLKKVSKSNPKDEPKRSGTSARMQVVQSIKSVQQTAHRMKVQAQHAVEMAKPMAKNAVSAASTVADTVTKVVATTAGVVAGTIESARENRKTNDRKTKSKSK